MLTLGWLQMLTDGNMNRFSETIKQILEETSPKTSFAYVA